MEEKKKYPIGAELYVLYEEVRQGVSTSVFRATCTRNNEIIANKIINFQHNNSDLGLILNRNLSGGVLICANVCNGAYYCYCFVDYLSQPAKSYTNIVPNSTMVWLSRGTVIAFRANLTRPYLQLSIAFMLLPFPTGNTLIFVLPFLFFNRSFAQVRL